MFPHFSNSIIRLICKLTYKFIKKKAENHQSVETKKVLLKIRRDRNRVMGIGNLVNLQSIMLNKKKKGKMTMLKKKIKVKMKRLCLDNN